MGSYTYVEHDRNHKEAIRFDCDWCRMQLDNMADETLGRGGAF